MPFFYAFFYAFFTPSLRLLYRFLSRFVTACVWMAQLRALLLFFDIVYIFSWGSVTVCLMPFLRALYAVKAVGLCLFGRFTGFMAPFWHWLYLCLRILSCLFRISLDDFLTPLLHLFKRGKKTSHGCETRTPKQIQQVIGDFEAHWQVAGLAESEINAPSTQSDACRTLLWRLTVMTGSCNNKNTEETGYVPVAC